MNRRKPKSSLDPKDRTLITHGDLEDVFSQLITAPKVKTKSENREPTKRELSQRYRLVRRG